MGLVLITEPVVEPITTAELREHCRIDNLTEYAYLDTLIASARKSVETTTGLSLINQTWEYTMDSAPLSSVLRLPLPPLVSVTSIKSYDQNDTESIYAATSYRVDGSDHQGGRIALKETSSWPSSLRSTNGLVIRFVAGYGATAASVPEPLRHAVKLLAAHWYENREPVNIGNINNDLPFMVLHLCWPFKVIRL